VACADEDSAPGSALGSTPVEEDADECWWYESYIC